MVSQFNANISARITALNGVLAEREAQDEKWGEQNHPDLSPRLENRPPQSVLDDLTSQPRRWWIQNVARYYGVVPADTARKYCDGEHRAGAGSWFSIHVEELGEALEKAALGDTAGLREELVQLAATVTAHIEHIDRRTT